MFGRNFMKRSLSEYVVVRYYIMFLLLKSGFSLGLDRFGHQSSPSSITDKTHLEIMKLAMFPELVSGYLVDSGQI